MKTLAQCISEASDNSVVIAQKDDPGKKEFVDMIDRTTLDTIMGLDVHPNTQDEKFNNMIEEFQNCWYNIIHYLEIQGFIHINGIKVNKNTNI